MTNHNFLKTLAEKRVLVGDGAMGTELYKRGLSAGCLENCNVSHPELIQDIYRFYYDAGSDVVETNSFGGNRVRLQTRGLANKVRDLNVCAAKLARQVCPVGKFVGGSIGPIGELLEPFGGFKQTEASGAFSEQAEALAVGGVDVIYVETMTSLDEAEVAVRAAKKATGLPIVAMMTLQLGKAGVRTSWGSTTSDMVHRLSGCGADVIGANCGRGFEEMVVVAKELRPLTSLPIIMQPNAGLPKMVGDSLVYDQTPETIRPYAEELLRIGVNVLGGCCGTGPEHIRMMRGLVDSLA